MKTYTAEQIFQKGEFLTLEIAKGLIGKTISVTNSEYNGNGEEVRTGKVLGIESAWDLASKMDHSHLDNGKWDTKQDYWKSFMSKNQIEKCKKRFKIVSDVEMYCTCEDGKNFFGSDYDRFIFFIIVDEN